jgi:hypothetical protein
MVNLNINVNPYHVVGEALRIEGGLFPEWDQFNSELAEHFKEEYDFISNERVRYYSVFIRNEQDLARSQMEWAIPIFRSALQNTLAKVLVNQTEDYKKKVLYLWNRNKGVFFDMFKKITGLDVPDIDIDVSLIHPHYNTGISYSKAVSPTGKDTIAWGHPLSKELPNYDSVYLAHEIMHIIFSQQFLDEKDGNKIEMFHALIELFSDNEFRIRLNGGKYFEWGSHKHLKDWEKAIYPYWIFFVYRNEKDILQKAQDAFNRDGFSFDIKKYYEQFREHNIDKMSIVDFWKFIINKILEQNH